MWIYVIFGGCGFGVGLGCGVYVHPCGGGGGGRGGGCGVCVYVHTPFLLKTSFLKHVFCECSVLGQIDAIIFGQIGPAKLGHSFSRPIRASKGFAKGKVAIYPGVIACMSTLLHTTCITDPHPWQPQPPTRDRSNQHEQKWRTEQ